MFRSKIIDQNNQIRCIGMKMKLGFEGEKKEANFYRLTIIVYRRVNFKPPFWGGGIEYFLGRYVVCGIPWK